MDGGFETKRILIITSSIDETATYIINRYSEQAEFFRIDVDKFDEYMVLCQDLVQVKMRNFSPF